VADGNNEGRATYQKAGLVLGPLAGAAMLAAGPPESLSIPAWHTAAMGVLMAIWWATEAVPIAVTALLPLVSFPLLGIADIDETAAPFANKVIYLFLGGFVVAIAMQRWELHRRIALTVLERAGSSGRTLVGGFMAAAAGLSMWVSNTSTTMMLLPIAVSVVAAVESSVEDFDERYRDDFHHALLLGIAYGASIGGMATLVGTPPNAMLAAFVQANYGEAIDFASWMLVGVPLALVMVPLAWLVLTRLVFRIEFRLSAEGRGSLTRMKAQLGPITRPEKRVAVVFAAMASLWILRPLLVRLPGLEGLDDAGIAMAGAVSLFLIPSGDPSDPMLLRWRHAEKLPWGVLILFGGGLALASAVSETGLAAWIGNNLHAVATLPLPFLVLAVAALIIFLTELTSNTATTATFLPVVGAIAIEAGVSPLVLTVPVALAAGCAFMLPVATPPNAIVFGSGLLRIPRMARAGLLLNISGIVLVTLVALFLAPRFLHGQ
jgi:solute carrier family 13 (sodium-dependent dicarboxylate transporter), member 2/3/5